MRVDLAVEASDLRARLGFQGTGWVRVIPVYLLLIGIFGVFLPWQKGVNFLDSVMLGAYACLGVVFAGPAATSEFTALPTVRKALVRVVISVIYGELVAGIMLLLGLVTVYVSHGGRVAVGPDLNSLAECTVLGLTLSLAVSMGAVWLSVKFSPGAAKNALRLVFLGLLAAFYLRSGWLPVVALRGAGISLMASMLFFTLLRAALRSQSRSA
jgi:hypothetical protein